MINLLRLLIGVIIAIVAGKVLSKIKLPAILAWLVVGMLFGPNGLNLISVDLLESEWYIKLLHLFECTVGVMIGRELVINKLKKLGKQIVITTLWQSLGTFFFVSFCFSLVFKIAGIPIFLSFIFGGIALATAPAPALSIVQEFKTKGPLTNTLIPMAALDDIVGTIVFFSVISIVSMQGAESAPLYIILSISVLLPIFIGIMCGLIFGQILKKDRSFKVTLTMMVVIIGAVTFITYFIENHMLKNQSINYMLVGMSFSAVFANLVSEERLKNIMKAFNPFLIIALIVVILNLGTPLDYHLIVGAGLYTFIYIVARGIGKYFGAYIGASRTKLPENVKKYLGLTLIPHSGVSLVFTGIAVTTLTSVNPELCSIVQGTISAAAIINEVIAVILSKKAFEWAGEINQVGVNIKN